MEREASTEDGRSTHYRLTKKGIALAPALLELLIWGAHHEPTDAPCAVIDQMEQNRAEIFNKMREICATYNVPLWDYSDSPISEDRNYFYNSQHLNADGAAA